MKSINWLLIVAVTLAGAGAPALEFESRCDSLAAWDVIDISGGGRAQMVIDVTAPPGYGPETLEVDADQIVVLARGARLLNGTIVLLYKELDPREKDADGVVVFGAEYGDDIAQEQNTQGARPHVWLEQDNDSGLHFRARVEENREDVLAERPGLGLVTDAWNETRWIWQKVRLAGGKVRAKYWPAQEPEPAEWPLEADWTPEKAQRIGFRVASGRIRIAYYAADVDDVPVTPPRAWLYTPQERALGPRNVPLLFFTNQPAPRAEGFIVSVYRGERAVNQAPFRYELPKDFARLDLGQAIRERTGAPLIPDNFQAGMCRVEMLSDSGGLDAECHFEILPLGAFGKRIEGVQTLLAAYRAEDAGLDPLSLALRDAAEAHYDHAVRRSEAGDALGADTSMNFALESLADLHARKAAEWPADLGAPESYLKPRTKLESEPWHYVAGLDMALPEPALEADSFVMGHEYKIALTWPAGVPKKIEPDLKAEISLVSPLGQRIVAKTVIRPETPTSLWRPGERAAVECTLKVAAPDDPPHPSAPIVLDESHYLLFSLIDTRTGARMLIDNAPGPQPDQIGKQFLLREVFVSSAPIEIREFVVATEPAGQGSHRATGVVHYLDTEPLGGHVLCRVAAETGELLYERTTSFALGGAGDAPIAFEWPADVAGAAIVSLEVLARGAMLTRATLPISLPLADGTVIGLTRGNRVEHDAEDEFITPISIAATPAPKQVRVYAAGRLVGEAKGSETMSIPCEPCFGYYDVEIAFDRYRVLRRIPATVAETRDGQLLVNGEPFIVKGLNVHSLDPASPVRTREMMRIFRGLGFNTLRMDAPPRWQVDLALEENLGCSLLPPFSVASSDAVFARFDGPPMGTARGVVRAFVQRYGDAPAVLLWNSCNEIGGDTTDFLLGLYPAFKRLDPYTRPVHYANLYGQDRWQGQDVMGVNYYFSDNQTARDRQPVINRSIDVAREHGLPVLYTEYNSYHGAIHPTGADAVRNLFGWGLDNGMCGGFYYFRFNSKDHPGVIDDGFNTHKILDDALREVFADAVLSRTKDESGALRFRIKNRRDFTLRQGRFVLVLPSGEELQNPVDDLAPRAETDVKLPIKKGTHAPVLAEGRFEFVTHFGFREKILFRLVAD